MTSTSEIASIVAELKHESAKIQTTDPQALNTINRLVEKLEAELNEPSENEPSEDKHESLNEQLSHLIETMEYSHPRVTALVNDLMVKLASLGV